MANPSPETRIRTDTSGNRTNRSGAPTMLAKVISGGQTGAARAFGISTAGWIPAGFLIENGPRSEFTGLYGAADMPPRDAMGAPQNKLTDFAICGLWRPCRMHLPSDEWNPSFSRSAQ
jgi:hypothetical protein